MNTSYIITVKDVYGVEEPTIPEGRAAKAFRVPKKGDEYLGDFGIYFKARAEDYHYRTPVIILTPAPKKLKEVRFVVVGENREPKAGEWYTYDEKEPSPVFATRYDFNEIRPIIYRREEVWE